MKAIDALEQLKNLTAELEEIVEKEPEVEIDFDVEGEYWIDCFWDIEREEYYVKHEDYSHYYKVVCYCHC